MSELVLKGLGIERVDDLGAKKAELAFLFCQGEHSSFEFYMQVFLGLGSTRFDKYVLSKHRFARSQASHALLLIYRE